MLYEAAELAYLEYLYTLSLTDLRILGREKGVRCCSTLNKEPLAQEIVDVILGKTERAPRSKKGAPVKHGFLNPEIYRKLDDLRKQYPLERENSALEVRSAGQECPFDDAVYCGLAELNPEGFGYVYSDNYSRNGQCVFLPAATVKKYRLREGDLVSGTVTEDTGTLCLTEIHTVNDRNYSDTYERPYFERLKPVRATERIAFGSSFSPLLRMLDLCAPASFGARMIVGTSDGYEFICEAVRSLRTEHSQILPVVLLIDETPEDTEEIREAVGSECLFVTTSDEDPKRHVAVAELALTHAKRLVEQGEKVVFFADLSLLAKAYRAASDCSEVKAVAYVKRFFVTARNTADGGSLTMFAFLSSEDRLGITDELKSVCNGEIYFTYTAEGRAVDLTSYAADEIKLLTEREQAALSRFRENVSAEELFCAVGNTENNQELLDRFDELFAED